MSKPNAMLSKMEEKYKTYYENLFNKKMFMLLQMGLDVAIMTANDVLQLGKGRAEAFQTTYTDNMNQIASIVFADQKDDKDFVYAKSKVDERIKTIVGEEKFICWEERYKE